MSNLNKDYLNSNGLVNGKIPAGSCCPFLDTCKLKIVNRCPSKTHQPPGEYSCAAARLWSITLNASNDGHPNKLLEIVRDSGRSSETKRDK